jgi:DNA-binding transcriptional LysR family regulator
VLTPAGQAVTSSFHGLHGSLQAMGRALHELHLGSAGKLCVGSIMAAAPTHLSDAVIAIKQAYPLLSVEIAVDTSDRLIDKLRDGSLDLVVGRVPHPSDRDNQDCIFRAVGDEALSVVTACCHPLATRAPGGANGDGNDLALDDLLAYPWILQPSGSPMRAVIEQEFRLHHRALPPGLIETASIVTTTQLLARSQMIAVMPHTIASHYQTHGLLRILPYPLTPALSPWGTLVLRHRPVSAVTQAFMDSLYAVQR